MKESTPDVIYGIRPVTEAIKAGREIDKVLLSATLDGTLSGELKRLLADKKIVHHFVPAAKIDHYTRENHQGVLCFLAPISYQQIENLLPLIFESGKVPLLVILDRITDVRNFGAIARTAECAGCDAIIIPEKGSAQINSDAVKTSAGALYKIPVCRENNLKMAIEFIKASGVQVIACSEKANVPHFKMDFKIPSAIILGSEDEGIAGEYLKRSDLQTFVPMMGSIESLNVSVACGVVLFEAMRQREKF